MYVFLCAQQCYHKSAAKRTEHRQGSLQSWRSPRASQPIRDHEHRCYSTCKSPPQYGTWWPRALSNRKLYFENSALFSQRLAVCLAMSAQTRIFSNSPSNTKNFIMTTHARALCSTFIFWTAHLVARCSRLYGLVSWRCAAPNRLLFASHSLHPTVLPQVHWLPKTVGCKMQRERFTAQWLHGCLLSCPFLHHLPRVRSNVS